MVDHYPRKPSHHVVAGSSAITHPAVVEDISDEDTALIAQRREDFLALMQDGLPFIRDLHACGAIDGWRCLQWVRPLAPPEL